MILATHALTGAVIGKNLSNPYLIILLSIIVHFAMDTLRHGEYLNRKSSLKNTWWKVAVDITFGWMVIGIILFTSNQYLVSQKMFNIFLGIFFSMLPDLFTILYWKLNIKPFKFIFNFHAKIHKYPQNAPERKWTFRNARNDILILIITTILLLL